MAMEAAAAEISTDAVRAQLFAPQPGSLAARVAAARAQQRSAAAGEAQQEQNAPGAHVASTAAVPAAEPFVASDEDATAVDDDLMDLRFRFSHADEVALDEETVFEIEDVPQAPAPQPRVAPALHDEQPGTTLAPDGDLAQVQSEIAAAQEELAALRRRRAQEQEELAQAARADALAALLPLVDDFDRALAQQPAALASDPWAQGIALIGGGLHALLARQGLDTLNPLGTPFDPYRHEVVAHLATDTVAPETVTAVYRAGYVLAGRVLRPAQVQVAVPTQEVRR